MTELGIDIRSVRLGEDAWELTLAGELDMHDAPALQQAFDDAARAGAQRLLVDLSAVPFVDSSVLGVLAREARRVGTLVLAVGDSRVLRVLEITGLLQKLTVERSRSEALATLARGRLA